MNPFYEKKREGILKSFDSSYKKAEKYLMRRFDEKTALRIRDDALELIEEYVPQLPDVGGRNNQFIQVILLNAWYIPFFQAAREQGLTVEEYVKMIIGSFHATITRYPRFLRHIGGSLVRSSFFMRRMKRESAISRERKFTRDWIYSVSDETGSPDALFKVEYSQCAVCEMMKDAGVEDLMQYCNAADFLMAKALGFGFENPIVLGRGAETCVGIFRKDRVCEIPDYLEFAFKGLEF